MLLHRPPGRISHDGDPDRRHVLNGRAQSVGSDKAGLDG